MSAPLFFILITACLLQLFTSALLSVVPVLIPESAGIAFSVYSFSKLFFLFFAGKITTRLRSQRTFALSILLECISLFISGFFPTFLIYSRVIEGFALAVGMVSSFTLLREMNSTEVAMEKSVAKIMIASGASIVLGQWIGGIVADAHPVAFLKGAGFLFIILLVFVLKLKPFSPFEVPKQAHRAKPAVSKLKATLKVRPESKISKRRILILAATHAIGIGLQPLIAFWGKNLFPVKTYGGGVTFLAIGLGFFTGIIGKNERLVKWTGLIGLTGFICLEFSVQLSTAFSTAISLDSGSRVPSLLLWPIWLLAVTQVGFWYASRSKKLTAELGLSGAEHAGEDQAWWLFWSGIPSALVPMVSWKLREPNNAAAPRLALEALLLGISVILPFFLESQGKKEVR